MTASTTPQPGGLRGALPPARRRSPLSPDRGTPDFASGGGTASPSPPTRASPWPWPAARPLFPRVVAGQGAPRRRRRRHPPRPGGAVAAPAQEAWLRTSSSPAPCPAGSGRAVPWRPRCCGAGRPALFRGVDLTLSFSAETTVRLRSSCPRSGTRSRLASDGLGQGLRRRLRPARRPDLADISPDGVERKTPLFAPWPPPSRRPLSTSWAATSPTTATTSWAAPNCLF